MKKFLEKQEHLTLTRQVAKSARQTKGFFFASLCALASLREAVYSFTSSQPWVGPHPTPSPRPSPLPLSRPRERGAGGGVTAFFFPRARALGYHVPPLTGLWSPIPRTCELINELLSHNSKYQQNRMFMLLRARYRKCRLVRDPA